MSRVVILFAREFGLAWGRGGGLVLALGFYAAITALTPLASGSDPDLLAGLAIGSAWLALALSSLLSLERLFERDYEDGALDLLVLGPAPLPVVCLVKALAHWASIGLPLALAAPVAMVALGAPSQLAGLALLTALIGGLGFSLTGAMGAALSLGSRRGGLLIAVVVLPLFIPPVVFGAGVLTAAAQGLAWAPGLALLGAWTLFALALSPMVAALAVREALD